MTLPHPPSAADRVVFGRPFRRPRPSAPALVLLIAGAAMLLSAYTVLHWFRAGDDIGFVLTGPSTRAKIEVFLPQIGTLTNGAASATWPARIYFSWLGWVLLVAVLITGLIAALPNRFAVPAGRLGGALAALGVVATVLAVKLVGMDDPTLATFEIGYDGYLSHARLGFWLACGGFLVAGIGAFTIAPRAPREPRI